MTKITFLEKSHNTLVFRSKFVIRVAEIFKNYT